MFESNLDAVKIIEVGPRDGLQNEETILETEFKFEYIKKLVESGLKTIEVTSFVRPPAIPQMHDAKELFEKVRKEYHGDPSLSFPCLVPNVKGLEKAMDVGVGELALFSATSDTFTKKNINCTVEESFVRMREIRDLAVNSGIKMRGYISTAFGCPYEGEQGVEKLIRVIENFLDLGVYEISIGDTIGVATPGQVNNYLKDVLKSISAGKIAMHMHDTRGMAISNIVVSLEAGIRAFDSSSGGLGGCPYANGATGNVATEDLLYLLDSLGIYSGVDMDSLVKASEYILEKVNKSSPSKFFQTIKPH